MKIHIIDETKVSEVALLRIKPPVRHQIWIGMGELPLLDEDDDLDEFTLSPIYEVNVETGKREKSKQYFMGSITHEVLLKLVESNKISMLIDSLRGEESIEFVKKLHDTFQQLGHEVILIELIDY